MSTKVSYTQAHNITHKPWNFKRDFVSAVIVTKSGRHCTRFMHTAFIVFFFWLCHGGYTGRTTGLTEFTLFEIVYVILLIINKRQPNQRRQRCLPHFVRRERNKKSITFPGPSPNPNPIPITHSLNHLANKLLRTTSTPYGLNRSSARRIMNI